MLGISSVVSAAPITSPFGWRIHPITGEWKFHSGVDIGYDYGTGIPAMLDGRVVYAAPYGGYGNCIILEHAGGDHTLYAHCSALYASYGQYVSKGTVIAAVGSTGFLQVRICILNGGIMDNMLILWGCGNMISGEW